MTQREGLLVLVQLGRGPYVRPPRKEFESECTLDPGLDLPKSVRGYFRDNTCPIIQQIDTQTLGIVGYIGIVHEPGVKEIRNMGVNAVHTFPLDPSFFALPKEWDKEAKELSDAIRCYQRMLNDYRQFHELLASGRPINPGWRILNTYTPTELEDFLIGNIVNQLKKNITAK